MITLKVPLAALVGPVAPIPHAGSTRAEPQVDDNMAVDPPTELQRILPDVVSRPGVSLTRAQEADYSGVLSLQRWPKQRPLDYGTTTPPDHSNHRPEGHMWELQR